MYNTVSIKEKYKEVFFCGDMDSKEVILIIGSCRVVPYLNYIDHYNKLIGNKYKVCCIDPLNYHWDENGKDIDYDETLIALESDEHFLSILRSVKIFIHEGLSNHRILNTVKSKEVNIYNFGMSPEMDINIPNFHDVFILFNDFYAMDTEFKRLADRELRDQGKDEILSGVIKYRYQIGNEHIERFLNICRMSSFPEFAEYFKNNYLKIRLFHTFNHVSKHFTLEIFRMMNEKFLHWKLDEKYWTHEAVQYDMYESIFTPLCEYDLKHRAFEWNEKVVDFKEYNKI